MNIYSGGTVRDLHPVVLFSRGAIRRLCHGKDFSLSKPLYKKVSRLSSRDTQFLQSAASDAAE